MCNVIAVAYLGKEYRGMHDDLITKAVLMLKGGINRGKESWGMGFEGLDRKPNELIKRAQSALAISKEDEADLKVTYSGDRRIVTGHNRYVTTNLTSNRGVADAQPHLFSVGGQAFIICANGDLPFHDQIRQGLLQKEYKFLSGCDAEDIVTQIGDIWINNGHDEENAFMEIGKTLNGAFSIAVITPRKRLLVMRDPIGPRPLWHAFDEKTEMFYVCSESGIIERVASVTPIEVKPGELIVVDPRASDGHQISHHIFANNTETFFCSMEPVYIGRPDSRICDEDFRRINTLRTLMGHHMGLEYRIKQARFGKTVYPTPDVVCSLPQSGNNAAAGFAMAMNVPLLPIIEKDSSGMRMFMSDEVTRAQDIATKLIVNPDYFNGSFGVRTIKSVFLIDDSGVRGQQSSEAIKLLRKTGCEWIGCGWTYPPHRYPCFYGLNTHEQKKLVGFNRTDQEVCQFIGADLLHYLSLNGFFEIMGHQNFCSACVTGKYPTLVPRNGKREA